MTLDEFKVMTKDLPGDTPIITQTDNSMEMGHSLVKAKISKITVTASRGDFRDAFDNEAYSADIFKYDPEGKSALIIRG